MNITYDELRGNPRNPMCLVSLAVVEELYTATEDIWEWKMPADLNGNYRTIPIIRLEALFKPCPIEDPLGGPMGGMLTSVLHLFDFIEPAVQQLIVHGWLLDEDGNSAPFTSREQANEAAWKIIEANAGDPAYLIRHDSFDSLDPLVGHPLLAHASICRAPAKLVVLLGHACKLLAAAVHELVHRSLVTCRVCTPAWTPCELASSRSISTHGLPARRGTASQ